eukprot:SAG31_NODE_3723_length_3948_cov_4.219018_2_plen_440_part_00
MGWARVLLVLDKNLASLRQEAVVTTGTVKESLFWWRYFRRVYAELNDEFIGDWGEDEDDEDSYDEEGFDEAYDAISGPGHARELEMARIDSELGQRAQQERMQQQKTQPRAPPQMAPPEVQKAVADRDLSRLQQLITDRTLANTIFDGQKGFTLLHIAVLQENSPMARHLIDCGAAVDPVSIHQVTPFLAAAARGNLDLTRMLVQAGCNINIPAQNGALAVQFTEAKGIHAVSGYLRAIYTLKAASMGGDPPMTADALIQKMAAHMQSRLKQLQAQRQQKLRQQQQKQQAMAMQHAARSRQLEDAQATAEMDRQRQQVHAELRLAAAADANGDETTDRVTDAGSSDVNDSKIQDSESTTMEMQKENETQMDISQEQGVQAIALQPGQDSAQQEDDQETKAVRLDRVTSSDEPQGETEVGKRDKMTSSAVSEPENADALD